MSNYEGVLFRESVVVPFHPPFGASREDTGGRMSFNDDESCRHAVTVKSLSVTYGRTTVLGGVSTTIHEGRITALIGPSGCGKTTFLSCLNRLIDFAPGAQVKGEVRVGGEDIYAKSCDLRTLRRKVGMVFQRPNPFPFSIRKNIELPLKELGIKSRREISDRVEVVLKDVGLWAEVENKLDASALSLSGGQQQRLCIARALALAPEILLMDEPCSALDPRSSSVVEGLIASMKDKYTVVIVTHNLAQARRIADDVTFFWVHNRAGTIIETGKCCQVFESPTHRLTADYVCGATG